MTSHKIHRERGPKSARVYIITVSTSRYHDRSIVDESGDLAAQLAAEAGHVVVGRDLLPDDLYAIRKKALELLSRDDVDVVVFTGGTGLAKTDFTVEALRPLFEKEIEGFGDVFRIYSVQEVGTSAFLTRATAGVAGGKVIVALPGSPNAVKVAMRILLEEISHLLYLVR